MTGEAVPLMTGMTSIRGVLTVLFVLAVLISGSTSDSNEGISEKMKKIFLSKGFNSSESEWVLKSARESYFLLKSVEKGLSVEEKSNFVKNYGNFLMKLFDELQTKDVDVHEIFAKENSFLKEYNSSQSAGEFDVMKLLSGIESIEMIAEQELISHHNVSGGGFDALEILALNETAFDVFVKEKLRADYSEIGYFFLEVFATLIGLSWGIISTVLHVARPMNE